MHRREPKIGTDDVRRDADRASCRYPVASDVEERAETVGPVDAHVSGAAPGATASGVVPEPFEVVDVVAFAIVNLTESSRIRKPFDDFDLVVVVAVFRQHENAWRGICRRNDRPRFINRLAGGHLAEHMLAG